MNSAADLAGAFIVLDVTTLAFAQILNMRETARTMRDRLDSDKFKGGNGQASLFTFQSSFENVHTIRSRDTV